MRLIVRLKGSEHIQGFMHFVQEHQLKAVATKNLEYLVTMVYGALDPNSVRAMVQSVVEHPSILDSMVAPSTPPFSANDFA